MNICQFKSTFIFFRMEGDVGFLPANVLVSSIVMPAIATHDLRSTKRKVRSAPPSMEAGVMVVRLRPAVRLTPGQLVQFCLDNSELRVEQTALGELIIMPPTFSDTGSKELEVGADLCLWARRAGGKVFSSNAGFTLPNSAMRSPDASWVRQERWDALKPKEKKSFAPLCPDFVVELRSSTDRLVSLQEKMLEYLANGAQLGWLIDPLEKQVFVYRPGVPVEHLRHPATLSGEPVLAGFTLDLARVW